jgi:hypothetical protein
MLIKEMPVSENFVGKFLKEKLIRIGKNYWGLVQQNGPWRETRRDVANQHNYPIAPGPAGQGRFMTDSTSSFRDQFGVVASPLGPVSRYAQFSIVSGHGRAFTPYNPGNPEKGDSAYQDPQSQLNIEGNAFGLSLDNEWAPKPVYPKATAFVTEDYLAEQAVQQEEAPAIQLSESEQQAIAEDLYDTLLSGVAPMRAQVERQKIRDRNLQKTLTQTPGELVYNENFLPSRQPLEFQNIQIHSDLQPREDHIIDLQNQMYNYQQGMIEQSLDPDRSVF